MLWLINVPGNRMVFGSILVGGLCIRSRQLYKIIISTTQDIECQPILLYERHLIENISISESIPLGFIKIQGLKVCIYDAVSN